MNVWLKFSSIIKLSVKSKAQRGRDLLTSTELSSVSLEEEREEKLYQLGTHDGETHRES